MVCAPKLAVHPQRCLHHKTWVLPTEAKAPTVWHTDFKLNPQTGTQHMGISSLHTHDLGKSCLLVGEGAQKLGRKPLLSRRVPGFVPTNITSALRNRQQTNTSRSPGTGIGAGCVLVVKHWAGPCCCVHCKPDMPQQKSTCWMEDTGKNTKPGMHMALPASLGPCLGSIHWGALGYKHKTLKFVEFPAKCQNLSVPLSLRSGGRLGGSGFW
jgi:hypothetical protein